MSSLWALVFLFALFTSVKANDIEANNYIVRVRNDMKPSSFSDVEQWYRSTLRSLDSNIFDAQTLKKPDLLHVYKTIFHGFAAELTPQQAELLQARPEVLAVYPNQILQVHTTRTPQFLGLVNDNNAPTPSGLIEDSDHGSNVIIGVLDTGVWPERESYDDEDLGSIPSHWKGECVEGQNFTKNLCNKKLIGARYFGSGGISGFNSTRDSEGHGTHTSTTAAGKRVLNVSLFGYAPGIATGIASKARVAAYKICWPFGCRIADIIAAYDKAVEDGVDIISFSVGGPVSRYNLDPLTIAQFGAMEHNVLVSASAGNSGPTGSLGNISPWVITVGASTIDRTFPADLILQDGTVLAGVSLYVGHGLPENTTFPIIYARNKTSNHNREAISLDPYCMPGGLDPKLVRGKIVVCERGGLPRAQKGEVVKKAGGVGMVLVNLDDLGETLIADAHVLPAVAITLSSTTKLLSYIGKSEDPRATIVFRGTELNVHPAPVVAGFSSRGPNRISDYIMKPDLIAPGVSVLAAWPDGVGPTTLSFDKRKTKFNILSGTSMSCPHISGIAALLKGAHPDWSPARIKSALMTTSYVVDNQGNELLDECTYNTSSAWGYGSGHVNPEKAGDPGLVYDLTVDDYIDFLCASGYTKKDIVTITRKSVNCKEGLKAWDLNYPAIVILFNQTDALKYEVKVPRTVTQVSEGASTYTLKVENPPDVLVTVDPPTLEFTEKEQKLSYVVNISAKKFDLQGFEPKAVFGRITWVDGKHEVGMPIVVTQRNGVHY